MPVTWQHYHGFPNYSHLEILIVGVGVGGATFLGATSTTATFASGIHKAILKGELVIGLSGEPESGFIETVELYESDVLVATGTGYHLTLDEIDAAFNTGQGQAFALLLFNEPMVIKGSNDGEELVSSPFDDRILGKGGDDEILGREGNDVLLGGADNDGLIGLEGHDKLKGGKGRDGLVGGDGNDLLIGGRGKDTYRFDAALDALANVDTIKKFSHKHDTIELSGFEFAELLPGTIDGGQFRKGKNAKDADDHVVYNDGRLFYDADGSGPGEKILFAKLKGAPKIDADDFFVV